jgi:hypothetical protein
MDTEGPSLATATGIDHVGSPDGATVLPSSVAHTATVYCPASSYS